MKSRREDSKIPEFVHISVWESRPGGSLSFFIRHPPGPVTRTSTNPGPGRMLPTKG